MDGHRRLHQVAWTCPMRDMACMLPGEQCHVNMASTNSKGIFKPPGELGVGTQLVIEAFTFKFAQGKQNSKLVI